MYLTAEYTWVNKMIFVNPEHIEHIQVVLDFTPYDNIEYNPKRWYRSKPYWRFALCKYYTPKELYKDFPEVIIKDDNTIWKKPRVIIYSTSGNTIPYFYDTIEECANALKVFLADLRTACRQTVRVNRMTEDGPISL